MSGKQFPAFNDEGCANGHTWKKNDQIYWEKLADGKVCKCKDLECFKKQGGTFDPAAKPKGSGRTIEMCLTFAKAFDDYAWNVAKRKALELYPDGSVTNKEDLQRQRAIATESVYSTLANAFSGK